MGRVDGNGSEERIDLALEVVFGEGAGLVGELFPIEEVDFLLAKFGEQLVVPALVLGFDEGVDFRGENGEGFCGAKAVIAGLAVAVFDALHESGLADFDVFVEVGAGDGEELDALDEWVGGIFGFFEDAAIELHPGVVASVEELLFLCGSSHGNLSSAVLKSLPRLGGVGIFRAIPVSGVALRNSLEVAAP